MTLKILFVREREQKQGELQAEQAAGQAGSPLSREPDPRLDPRTPGSWPGPKANA